MKTFGIYNDVFFRQKPFYLPRKLWEVVCYRANPRSAEYMKDLLQTFHPEAEIISFNDLSISADKVIILYPDAIGLGQGLIESRLKSKNINIFILSGRKHYFKLTNATQRKLRLRRFLEISFLFEFLCTPFILIFAGFAAIKDKIMGRS